MQSRPQNNEKYFDRNGSKNTKSNKNNNNNNNNNNNRP